MVNRRYLLLLLVVAFPVTSATLASASYDRFLLPVYFPFSVDGALGSRWISEVTLSNGGDQPVQVKGVGVGCPFDPCPDIPIQPGVTVPLFFRGLEINAVPGRFIDVQHDATAFAIQLRIRDVSRENLSFGTELPVVHESRAVAGTLNVANIPLAPNYRQLLRIYDFSQTLGAGVRIRFFDVAPSSAQTWLDQPRDVLLREATVPFLVRLSDQPGYAQFSDFGPLIAASLHAMLRIQMEPLNPNSRIWALVTLTNNDTQQVTIVSPK